MKLCETYPSCGKRGAVQSASTSRLLVASNDNRKIPRRGCKTIEKSLPIAERTPQYSERLDRLGLVPYGYIEAGVQDLGPVGFTAFAFALTVATLLIVGSNTLAKIGDFLMFRSSESGLITNLAFHWATG